MDKPPIHKTETEPNASSVNQRKRNISVGLALAAFVLVMYWLAIVKYQDLMGIDKV